MCRCCSGVCDAIVINLSIMDGLLPSKSAKVCLRRISSANKTSGKPINLLIRAKSRGPYDAASAKMNTDIDCVSIPRSSLRPETAYLPESRVTIRRSVQSSKTAVEKPKCAVEKVESKPKQQNFVFD